MVKKNSGVEGEREKECAAAARSLLTIPRTHGREKNLLEPSSSLSKWKEKKKKDERQWNGFLFFLCVSVCLCLVKTFLCVERLRIGLFLLPLCLYSSSHCSLQPMYIYTNIKRYRTQTVDFSNSFPYRLRCERFFLGFVFFPFIISTISIFSRYLFYGERRNLGIFFFHLLLIFPF